MEIFTLLLGKITGFEVEKVEILPSGVGNFTLSRGRVSLTRHILPFGNPVALTTATDQHYKDKEQLKSIILGLRASGMSYRQIGTVLGLHWTRVGQIIRSIDSII